MTYRADIDGLRAAAILPVLLYHAEIPLFGGGFVGVDVFFVISGYLITRLILAEMENGSFSIARFYERRARRILPALMVMIGASLAAGWFLLAPGDYQTLGRSAVAALLSFSNFFFFDEVGYFDSPAAEKPLLHTWSLGIEEQFYLVFPLLLGLVIRYRARWRIGIILGLCVASFGACVAITPAFPTAAFFLPHLRAWELLLGALAAMWAPRQFSNQGWAEAGAALGLGLIVVSIAAYSDETVFPGWAAAAPAIGTALLIWSGSSVTTAISRQLARPVPVFIGKISYSLYLWHFPLLAFAHYTILGALSPLVVAAILAATVGIALLSWRFVESPARNHVRVPRAVLIRSLVAAAAGIYAMGMLLMGLHGLPGRISSDDLRALAVIPERNDDRQHCYSESAAASDISTLCPLGAESSVRPSFVVWGDSHGEAMRGAIDIAARKFGQSGVFAGERGCAPLLGVQRLNWTDCVRVGDRILDMVVRDPAIERVILIARWGIWAERSRYKLEAGPAFVIRGGDLRQEAPPDNHATFAAGLEQTIAALRRAGKDVWLVGPVPEIGYNVPRVFFLKSIGLAQNLDMRPSSAEFEERQRFSSPLLVQFAAKYQAHLIWPHAALCDDGRCQVERNGRSLYFDDDHLSGFGADSLAGIFEPIFNGDHAALRTSPGPAESEGPVAP